MNTNRINSTRRNIVKPSLGRRFETFLGKKKHSANVMSAQEIQDDAPSRPVVRFVVVLMLLQIIVVGGILARGYILKSGGHNGLTQNNNPTAIAITGNSGNAQTPETGQTPAVTTPQNTDSGQTSQDAPQSTNQVSQNTAPLDLPQPEGSRANPIDPTTPVLGPGMVQGSAQATPQGAGATTPPTPVTVQQSGIKHLVVTSDTWESIAKDNHCSTEDLKSINPDVILRAGIRVQIPLPEGITKAEIVDESAPKAYKIKKGDNLSKIAKAYNTTVKKIMEANNLKESDLRRLQVGQEIQIP